MLPTHTYYSFRFGTLSPEEVLEAAMANDYEVVALADINSTAGSINFVRLAQKKGIKPVLGIDFRNGAQPCFVAYAKNNEGFKEINAYLSQFLHSGEAIPAEAPPFKSAFVIYPFTSVNPEVNLRPNEFIGVHPRDLVRLSRSPLAVQKNKLVMWHPYSFDSKRQFNAHRLLRAIDNNSLLSKLPKSEEGHPDDRWMHRNEMMA
ncbi:MAG TPA: PHP domain-containing protein, partial [Cryomorphaceae bacterium]|nr:PHP domain-containing protein [Cryomorphaceae bacterium]